MPSQRGVTDKEGCSTLEAQIVSVFPTNKGSVLKETDASPDLGMVQYMCAEKHHMAGHMHVWLLPVWPWKVT